MRTWLAVVLIGLVLSVAAFAQNVVTANQGKPGTQGAWPVTITSGAATVTVSFDGGFIGTVTTQPCSRIVSTNDAGIGTTPSRIPANGPTASRIWIRICNSILNSSSTQCICSADTCPSTVAVFVQGDVLATADCVTYPLGTADAGVPCCVCNGAGSFLPSTECVP